MDYHPDLNIAILVRFVNKNIGGGVGTCTRGHQGDNPKDVITTPTKIVITHIVACYNIYFDNLIRSDILTSCQNKNQLLFARIVHLNL